VWLLSSTSGGLGSAALLIAVTGLSLLTARLLDRQSSQRLRLVVARTAVPLAFAALVALNVSGLVGTLTGSNFSQLDGLRGAFIAMPFYLLSAAAFITDLALRRVAVPKALDFAVYMMLPFKLLAGPLETPWLLSQISELNVRLRTSRLLVAAPWIALGAFMKCVIANRLDPSRNLVHVEAIESLVTAAVFELKFYFDFAGYSFMAYGACLALGLRISQNFNHPFLAPNVVLFWRSWHISLGRFLTRYVLEPNLSLFNGRQQKMVFASGIFLVSAMWHGGTLNYLAWGLFHGACYFTYVAWMKRRGTPRWLGVMAMLAFFVFGRMLAIDADINRLLSRIANVFNPWSYRDLASVVDRLTSVITASEARALMLAAAFLACEVISHRLYPTRRGYHLLRRPLFAAALWVIFVLFGVSNGGLLYARI
jgi:D-alanyl-lipoteichoic acid acyltransferase DltB (MBOAT superfamily)